MKKAISLVFMLIISKSILAQIETLPHSNLPGIFSDTLTVSATKDELYMRAKEYLAKNTLLKKSVIQMDDRDLGRLVANTVSTQKETISGLIEMNFLIKFTTSLSVKDNKYKYVINNVTYDESNVTPTRATEMIKKVIQELVKSMNTKSVMDF